MYNGYAAALLYRALEETVPGDLFQRFGVCRCEMEFLSRGWDSGGWGRLVAIRLFYNLLKFIPPTVGVLFYKRTLNNIVFNVHSIIFPFYN